MGKERLESRGGKMSVVAYIDDLLLEEERLDAALFQAAVKILEEHDSVMSYNTLTDKLKEKFPDANAYAIGFAADDAKEHLKR